MRTWFSSSIRATRSFVLEPGAACAAPPAAAPAACPGPARPGPTAGSPVAVPAGCGPPAPCMLPGVLPGRAPAPAPAFAPAGGFVDLVLEAVGWSVSGG